MGSIRFGDERPHQEVMDSCQARALTTSLFQIVTVNSIIASNVPVAGLSATLTGHQPAYRTREICRGPRSGDVNDESPGSKAMEHEQAWALAG